MDTFIIFKILCVIFCVIIQKGYGDKKTWTYELKSVNFKTANKDLVDCTIKVDRLSRGKYALSGSFISNVDIVEGDHNELEMTTFRSPSGNGYYSKLPFEMSRRHWHKALNTFYKDVLMEGLKDCCDMPQFEDEFQPPFEKKTYNFNRCEISQDGFPSHLEPGMYKVLIKGYGDVEWEIEVILDVQADHS